MKPDVKIVAGADVAFPTGGENCLAGIEKVYAEVELAFPYIPGLLSFREAPVILAAVKKLKHKPEVLLIDGQGLAHPRRFGLACHVGVERGWPTIGCAKSRLIGSHQEPGEGKGCWVDLTDKEELVGKVLRSRDRVKPLYISMGHRVDLDGAAALVLRCCERYRLPEPTRMADKLVGRLRKVGTSGIRR